jgi:hypothetical protein
MTFSLRVDSFLEFQIQSNLQNFIETVDPLNMADKIKYMRRYFQLPYACALG